MLVLSAMPVHAQKLVKLQETSSFTDYRLVNDSLNIAPDFELRAPVVNGTPRYQVLEQRIVSVDRETALLKQHAAAWKLPSTDRPPIEAVNPGMYRGQRIVSLVMHTTRVNDRNPAKAQVIKNLRLRIYKEDRPILQNKQSLPTTQASPLGTGTWYKIPVTRNGIYRLDADYLSELGLDVNGIDPRRIQLWTTSGAPLPKLNSAPRPSLQQIPVVVSGEDDGSFDSSDFVLFYGSSPNPLIWDADQGTYSHRIHPYSTRNYVFLTVGNTNGLRLSPSTPGSSPTRTIDRFTDFHWKEDELYKPEADLKSGIEWYGQKFSNQAGQQEQVILQDTIPGFVSSQPVTARIRMIGRSTNFMRFIFSMNGQSLGTMGISAISSYTGAEGLAARAAEITRNITVDAPDNVLTISSRFENSESNSTGFTDWIELSYTRRLTAKDDYLFFFAPRDGQADETGAYEMEGFSSEPVVMDITNPVQPVQLQVAETANGFRIEATTQPDHRFIAQAGYFTPSSGTPVNPQDLHGISEYPDYVIVTASSLLDQARRLADYRRSHDGLKVVVATQEEIFNEFSGGVPDVTAIRDFVRFLYERALQAGRPLPDNLLLFGDTSFDYKGLAEGERMKNLVFTYQSDESLSRTQSYGSDDFFGLLDDNEGNWSPFTTDERLDIGVGRLPAQNPGEAETMVNKIRNYETNQALGSWRTLFSFAADDDVSGSNNDRDLHALNAEGTAERLDREDASIRFHKIYEFSYPVENTAAGRRIPQATQDFIQTINSGTLVMNYSGHGAEQILSGERLFQSDNIPQLDNTGRPTIFVTATCSFGRYDDSESQSGAEKLVLWNRGGAVAAFTTTRVVYTSATPSANNFGLNIELSREMIQRDGNGQPQQLGTIYRNTKNTSIGAAFNSRKFILLGDPAMRIGLPRQRAELTSINNFDQPGADTTLTYRALDNIQLSGQLTDGQGQPLSGLNGEVNVTVFDASRFVNLPDRSWLPNCYLEDCRYRVQNDILFSGRSSVQNGQFNSRFIVPKDIAQSDSSGRIMFYASTEETDGSGSFGKIRFKGVNTDASQDNDGPKMDVYLNDETFVNGNLVDDSPRLIVDLSDKSGINTTGNGVGHEIIASLDTQPSRTFVLNDYYTSDLDDFTGGRVEYPLNELPQGNYTIKVRAWDVYNNPSEKEIHFQVAQSNNLVVKNIYNYPNPMNNFTKFVFEHNQPGNPLDVSVRIYTLSGRPVTRLEQQIISPGAYASIDWNGRDRDHDRLASGTYIYVLRVKATTAAGSQTREKIEKLVIIH